MRLYVIILTIAALAGALFAAVAAAVPPGRVLEWKTETGGSTVVFDGKAHADRGLKYSDCHPRIFKMKKGHAEMKMVDLINGKYCGECHNGEKAFSSEKQEFCSRCHKNM